MIKIKIIHQIWIGDEIPERYNNFCKEIEVQHPDYVYIFWDNSKIEEYFKDDKYHQHLRASPYYNNIPKAFLTNYYRLKILLDFGGWYIDADCEYISSLDILTNYDKPTTSIIVGYMNGLINNGVIYSDDSIHAYNILKEWMEIVKIKPTQLPLFENKDHRYNYHHLTQFRWIAQNHKDYVLILDNNYFYANNKKDAIILHHKCSMTHMPNPNKRNIELYPN